MEIRSRQYQLSETELIGHDSTRGAALDEPSILWVRETASPWPTIPSSHEFFFYTRSSSHQAMRRQLRHKQQPTDRFRTAGVARLFMRAKEGRNRTQRKRHLSPHHQHPSPLGSMRKTSFLGR